MNALQAETVPRVRRLLLQALESRQGNVTRLFLPGGSAEPERQQSSASAGSRGRSDVSAIVRHELSPAVGWIRLAADAEIPNFGDSRTNRAVRKLQRRIDGLVAMLKWNEPVDLQPFDLPELLRESWPDTATDPDIYPEPGEQSVEVRSDEGLFTMLLSNVFQNAIDASTEANGKPSVQINWGYTDLDFWIRVTNSFKGNGFSLTDVLAIGNSSKAAHQGHGLSLISDVASRLGLRIDLNGTSGVATFTLQGTLSDG